MEQPTTLTSLPSRPSGPKYVLAEQAILGMIQDRGMTPGTRLDGERELSRQLGISYMTCRKAVEGLVRAGHLNRRPSVGTFVSSGALARNVALLVFHVPSLETGTLSETELRIVREVAAADGRQVRAMLLFEPYPSPERIVAELRAMNVGVVGMLGFLNTDADFVTGVAQSLPVVLLNKPLAGVSLPYSAANTAVAAQLIVEYLQRRGRRRIGFINANVHNNTYNDIARALRTEMQRAGLPVEERLWPGFARYGMRDEVFDWTRRVLDEPDPPDALVNTVTHLPQMTDDWLRGSGRRVGRDLDFLCLLNRPPADEGILPWAQLNLNLNDAARGAARMLLALAAGRRLAPDESAYLAAPGLYPGAPAPDDAPCSDPPSPSPVP